MKLKSEIAKEIMSKAQPTDQERMDMLLDLTRDADNPSALVPALQTWVEIPGENEWCLFRLRHPLVYSVIGPLLPHQCNMMLARKWDLLKEAWRAKKWHTVIMLHERPYRMGVLEKLYFTDRLSLDELRELLLDIWTDTEIPQGNQDEPLALFRECGFITDDQKGFDALPAILTLYRGVDGVCELTPDGPSWTTDRTVADFFAKRYAIGKTYRFQVKKDDPAVLAWITDRNEAEIILDFDMLDAAKIEVEEDFS